MEYLLIHTMIGPLPPEVQKMIIETTKKRKEIAPGGKEICSYSMVGIPGAVCIWEAPNIEALVPLLEQLKNCGIKTEIIPLEKADVSLAKWEKTIEQFEQMAKK